MTENPDDRTHPAARAVPPALRTRLDACPEAEQTALETTWRLAGLGQADEPVPPVDAAWTRLEAVLDDDRPVERPRKARTDRETRRRRSRRFRGSLAILTVAAVVALVTALASRPVTIQAPPGTTMTASLPDGSRAELNSGSTLVYRRRLFGWTRTLRLDGEAFFEVVPADAPFTVETFNAAVIVQGTRFNVRAWPEDDRPETVVVLASGAVNLAARRRPEQTVRLAPGQMSRLASGATAPSAPQAVSVDRVLAWRSGGFAFNNQPLSTVFAEIERRFDVAITATPRSIEQDSLVLFVAHPPHAEAVLEAISRFRGYPYRATEDGYEIRRGKQP